jgi:hypothetical protein
MKIEVNKCFLQKVLIFKMTYWWDCT